MKTSHDKTLIDACLKKYNIFEFISNQDMELKTIEYMPGEPLFSPVTDYNSDLFQFVVEGHIQIYAIKNDGNIISDEYRKFHAHIGEYELIGIKSLFEAKAISKVTTLAISIDQYRNELLNDLKFMRTCYQRQAELSIAKITSEVVDLPLDIRTYNVMKNECENGILKGVEIYSTLLHCSSRQLQRALNKLVSENKIIKIGKGTYRCIK